NAILSRSKPVQSGKSEIPFGAAAAACIASANIFRKLFKDQLSGAHQDNEVCFSTLHFTNFRKGLSNPDLNQINLSGSYLLGVGAIGNAAIWALSKCPFISGQIVVVDPEEVEITNLQ